MLRTRGEYRRFRSLSLIPLLMFVAASIADGQSQVRSDAKQAAFDSRDVLRRANRSTVRIEASRSANRAVQTSSGAGVVLSTEGYIVTAHHVVRDYPGVRVTTQSGATLAANIVSTQPDYDIAVLKVDRQSGLEPACLANAERIHAGRPAVVIGNPLGAGQKAVVGKLGPTRTVTWDGKRAELRTLQAPVVPGDSGGGAFDRDTGELLGITVAKSSTQEDTGYVVPSDRLADILSANLSIPEVADAMEVDYSLGVSARPVSLVSGDFQTGLLLTRVAAKGPADRAGWRAGDVLVGFGRYRAASVGNLVYVLRDSDRSSSRLRFLLARADAVAEGAIAILEQPDKADLAQAATRARSR